jgi:hypothetical protein
MSLAIEEHDGVGGPKLINETLFSNDGNHWRKTGLCGDTHGTLQQRLGAEHNVLLGSSEPRRFAGRKNDCGNTHTAHCVCR